MPHMRLLTPVAGTPPWAGQTGPVVEVDEEVCQAWADGVRAVRVHPDDGETPEGDGPGGEQPDGPAGPAETPEGDGPGGETRGAAGDPPVDGTIADVKDWVGDSALRARVALAAEQDGKDRVTLVEWLQSRAEE